MKRLTKKDIIQLHLADIIKRIDQVIFCEDVNRTPYVISASTDIPEGEEMSEEQFYITFTDEQLAGMDIKEIHSFTNIELLGRIAKIDPTLLTAKQLKLLKDAYAVKVILGREDVEKILELIQQCKSVSYNGRHWKTNKFLKDNSGNIRKDDCLDILHQLTIEDYVATSRSYNLSHIGNHLIIFEPDSDWETTDGEILSNIKIYVKLDIDETDGSAVALVSMHQADYLGDTYPYRE